MKNETITIEDANIIKYMKNFGGDKWGDGGQRYFNVKISEDSVDEFIERGLKVNYTKPYNDGDIAEPYIKVIISFAGYSEPDIYRVVGRKCDRLTLEDLFQLDRDLITHADITFHLGSWEKGGNKGVSAYLDEAYFEVFQSKLREKYADYEY